MSTTAPDALPAPTPEPTRRGAVLPLLIVLLPLAVALARTPLVVGMAFAAFCLLAWHFRCLKGFLAIYAVAVLLNLPVLSVCGLPGDQDFYLGPQARLIAAGGELAFDGFLRPVHLALPTGYTGWNAALYRLTGSLDFGHAQAFALVAAAWLTLRRALDRRQTFALVCAPLTLVSLYNGMPDGCVYLLLLIALFAWHDRDFWLCLAALAVAAAFKTTAWVPGALIGAMLLWRFPRRWWQVALAALAVAVLVFPTLHLVATGGLRDISDDFLGADAAAQSLGWLGRTVYFYLGHWLLPGGPYDFNVHIGGVDGAGMDGLGALARLLVWPSLALLLLCRKRFAGWWPLIAVAWLSTLLMPTLYVGYGRYVPLAYVALLLPFVLRLPTLSVCASLAMAALPAAWVAWRVLLSMEFAQVAAAGVPVSSDWYNVRATFRSCGAPLVEARQPVQSASDAYAYADAGIDFPPFPSDEVPRGRLVPAGQKAARLKDYGPHAFLPWALTHPHVYLANVARIRWRWLVSPRGEHDGLPPPARQ